MNAILKALFIISLGIVAVGIIQKVDITTDVLFSLAFMYLIPYVGTHLTLGFVQMESKFRTAE